MLVIIAGLVVVGAGAAGWFLFNKSEPEVVAEPAPAPAPTAEKAPPPAMPSNKPPQNEVTVTPTTEPAPAGDKKPPREYYVDGKLIRDHRSGDKPPIDLPPVVRPPDARAMKAQSTSVLTKAMRIVLRDCVRAIPPEERTGEKPRVEAVVAVSVKDRAAKVTKSTVQLRDVRGSAADAAKSCIENNILSVQEGVDEADIESYDITTTLSF
ncbi:MAG: hypothetical protein ACKV2T_19180 [Kofleriaceae bacterium]